MSLALELRAHRLAELIPPMSDQEFAGPRGRAVPAVTDQARLNPTVLPVPRGSASGLPPVERYRQYRAVLYEALALGHSHSYIAQTVNLLRSGGETPTVADLRRALGLKGKGR